VDFFSRERLFFVFTFLLSKRKNYLAMPKTRTVCLSNALPPDSRSDAFAESAFAVISELAKSHNWRLRCLCGQFPNAHEDEDFLPIFSRPNGNSDDAKLWRGFRTLSANAVPVAKKAGHVAESADIFLVLNPCGLSIQEWSLALSQSRSPIPWVASDWPKKFPDCDPFWTLSQRHRHALFPATLIASALLRSLYTHVPNSEFFCNVRAAIFASENLREKNSVVFQNMERSAVIPPAVDDKIFTFRETSEERSRVWGWNGGFSEDSGVLLALETFARQAMIHPRMQLILAGDDANSADAVALRAKISAVPAIAERVVFAGKIPREKLAENFYQKIGLMIFIPSDESAFPIEAAEAMACGCLVFAAHNAEMETFLNADTPLFFNAREPDTALLMSDFIMKMSREEWAMIAADGIARVQEICSPARVSAALAEFLSK